MTCLFEFQRMRPPGGFNLIMADPPWSYAMYSAKGLAKAPEAHYRTMPIGEIKALPVEALSARDAVLWLWAVNPQLPQAIDVLHAWGFAFKTAGTWVKRTRHAKDAFGTGYILRSANEPFLIGTRGAPRTTRSTRSVVATDQAGAPWGEDWPDTLITIEAQLREHSAKPEAAYQAAEALMPGRARRVDTGALREGRAANAPRHARRLGCRGQGGRALSPRHQEETDVGAAGRWTRPFARVVSLRPSADGGMR